MKEQKKGQFEEHLAEVQRVVDALEKEELGLEESVKQYEIGKEALNKCYKILEEAEQKVEILMKDKSNGGEESKTAKSQKSKGSS